MNTIYALPQPDGPFRQAREQAVAAAMRELASELKLIDVLELIYLCRTGKHANISDLVGSAAELFFKADTVRYGGAAEAELSWNATPAITLDMEFDHKQVMMLFRLRLSAGEASVSISHIVFESFSGHPAAATDLLVASIADTRLTRPADGEAC